MKLIVNLVDVLDAWLSKGCQWAIGHSTCRWLCLSRRNVLERKSLLLFKGAAPLNQNCAATCFWARYGRLPPDAPQIFDKALVETTFTELYAGLCSKLNANLPEFDDPESEEGKKITFRRVLLNKCQVRVGFSRVGVGLPRELMMPSNVNDRDTYPRPSNTWSN